MVVALACVLDSKHRQSHVIIVCSIAVVIGFMLAIVVSFDHPFTGSVAVSDRPIREFLVASTRSLDAPARTFRRASRPTSRRGPRPCPRPAA